MTIRSEDAYLSTVIGTLAADEGSVPQQIPTRTRSLELFPERKIPEVFWNQNEFRYSESAQKRAAPLIFIVAGTGASHRSSKMHYLGRLFFGEGFHVIALSSPTHPNFILAASSSGHPGFAPEDSEDLYRVMKEAYSALASKVEITEVHLTGYSLGGTQSAFLLAIDDREEAFHFEKVLMINPSVDLFASVRILDGLFRYALPDGAESVTNLIKRLLVEISDYSQQNGRRRVDGEMLYKIAEKRIAEGKPPTKKALAGLIAEAFRLSASNMFFTVDVLAAEGRLVKKGTKLKVGTSLTPYFSRSIDWSFERYFNEVLLPYWQSRLADLDREALIERASLRSLERMLSEDPRIAAVTNADDIILTPEDLEFLRTSMGDRIKIYPRGGHCGNLSYRENSDYMIRFFQGGGALNKRMLAALLLLLVTVNIGCATGTAPSSDADPIAQAVYDPWEPMNRHTYRFNANFDKYVFVPVIRGYRFVVPQLARTGLSNFFSNIGELTIIANSILQFAPIKTAKSVARLTVNSTIGIGGLFDVAQHWNLPGEHEDFGQTLGFYGVGPGPYLVLPIRGPSSLRDTGGLVVDRAMISVPLLVWVPAASPYYHWGIVSRGDPGTRRSELSLWRTRPLRIRPDPRALPRISQAAGGAVSRDGSARGLEDPPRESALLSRSSGWRRSRFRRAALLHRFDRSLIEPSLT